MEKKDLENKAINKPRKKKETDIYVTTDTFCGLPEGVKKKISNKAIAEKLLNKGMIKKC